jgi:Fungal N-terminal domain of STAND proteins
MAGIGEAASIIAVVQITAQISKLCSGYLSEVKNAPKDVERLQSKISSLHSVLEKIEQMLRGSKSARLTMSTSVLEPLKRCVTDLEELKAKLDVGKRKKPMSRVGLRSLRWPFTRKEVEKAVEMLEGYTMTFNVALLADNMLEKSIRAGCKTS